MSLENLVLFVREDVVTVKAHRVDGGTVFAFVALRETITKHNLVPGSIAIASTSVARGDFQLVQIVEICDNFMDEPESMIQYRWVFQGVDTDILKGITDDMTVRVDQLKNGKRQAARRALALAIEDKNFDLSRFENPLRANKPAAFTGADNGKPSATRSVCVDARGNVGHVPVWAEIS